MTAVTGTGMLKSSGLPLTQHTAPVLDFRCLYTHDLRQKKKRWHDGLLRFHTFNSRIMVYDVSRNFIGDKYWREPETIQDGDELELEKGVLIQVEEATGRTEQDLAPILNHHKTSSNDRATATPVRAHVTSTAVSVAASTAASRDNTILLKPKSLNTLLGTPRGKYGRASIPEKSPYQSRRELQPSSIVVADDSEQIERPAKRLKTAVNGLGYKTAVQLAREAAVVSGLKVNSAVQPRDQQARISTAGRRKASPVTNPITNLDADVEDTIASVVENVSSKSGPLPKDSVAKTKKNSKQNHDINTHPAQGPSPRSRKKDRQKDRRTSENDPREVSVTASTIPQDENLPPEDDPIPTFPERSSHPYTLRFAMTKPRRKLMYRDLLPDQPPSKSKGSLPHVTRNRLPSGSSEDLIEVEQVQKHLSERARKQGPLPSDPGEKGNCSGTTLVQSVTVSHPPIAERPARVTVLEDSFKAQDQQQQIDDSPIPVEDPWDMDIDDLDDFDKVDVSKRTVLAPSEPASAHLQAANPTLMNASPSSVHQVHNSLTVIQHAQAKDAVLSKAGLSPRRSAPPKAPKPTSLQNRDDPAANQLPPISKRSPIKKSRSENNTLSTKPNPAMVPTFKKQTSDMSSARTTRSALSAIRDRALGSTTAITPLAPNDHTATGPWSREAFDLFGWRPGDSKNITLKGLNAGS